MTRRDRRGGIDEAERLQVPFDSDLLAREASLRAGAKVRVADLRSDAEGWHLVPDPEHDPKGDPRHEGVPEPRREPDGVDGVPGPILPDDHWSRSRGERNAETIEYLREKSRAPGVAAGGSHRNSYCLECGGVIPLEYDSREPAKETAATCPHCGAVQETRVRAMFNWVELDQVPKGDLATFLPWILGAAALALGALIYAIFG